MMSFGYRHHVALWCKPFIQVKKNQYLMLAFEWYLSLEKISLAGENCIGSHTYKYRMMGECGVGTLLFISTIMCPASPQANKQIQRMIHGNKERDG